MTHRPIVVVVLASLAALVVLVLAGRRVLERDRVALYDRYAGQRTLEVEEAAHELEAELADLSEDLDLAATLLQNAEPPDAAQREMHAIATIKREYDVIDARAAGRPPTHVVAFDTPAGVPELTSAAVARTLDAADAAPGMLAVSEDLRSGNDGPWYRVYARRSPRDQVTIAIVVDMRIVLTRVRMASDPLSRVLLLGPEGRPTPNSDARLAAKAGRLIAMHGSTSMLDAGFATELGLPASPAVAVTAPIAVTRGTPWRLLVVSSASRLDEQERLLVRRVLVGCGLVFALLVLAAAYVILNTRRAAMMRERLRMAGRLVRSEKLVTAGQLAAGIAHEVGTPLNVARGRIELAMSHLGSGHAEASNHEVAIDQIDRVTRLIQQLLDYVRPTPEAMQTIDVAAALHTVRDLLATQATKRGVTLDIAPPGALPAIRANPDQVQQVLVNLVLNALDACDRKGRVELSAVRRGESIVMEVRDDGHGIPRDAQAQVFDPFFTTKKRGQGTGLGLWVVAQIVRAHAGEIELESSPEAGTRIRVAWPVTP
jgi:signal transduction histidine kinase